MPWEHIETLEERIRELYSHEVVENLGGCKIF